MKPDLWGMLEDSGIQGLRDGGKEIKGRCPGHVARTGHEDRHPSWSINKLSYLHSCFSCGYAGTLRGLLLELTGAAPEDLEDELRKQSFLRKLEIREAPEKELSPRLTEWILVNRLKDVPERLLRFRHLLRDAIDHYQVRWDPDSREWVLPLRDLTGLLLGAQYRAKGSVLTLPEGIPKSLILFGYQQVKVKDFAVLVESPLDAVRLSGLGIPAFSSLGAWVSKEQVRIIANTFSFVVLALDNDNAGREALNVVRPMLARACCPAVCWDYTGLVDDEGRRAKDVGDVASDEALLSAWDRTLRLGL